MPQDSKPATTTGRTIGSGRTRAAVTAPADRTAAFKRARRHTVMVRTLRVLLPVGVLALLGSYGTVMQRSIKLSWGDKKLEVGKIEISREALVAHNPRYTGFDKNGSEYVVRASTAEQDLKQKNVVRLKAIEGDLVDVNKQRTKLTATRGTLDSSTSVLEMFERIDVAQQNGMTAELTQATVYTKENRIVSSQPVTVRMPSGVVRGQAMTIEQKKREVLFTGGVVANLKQEPRSPPTGTADTPLRGTSATGAAIGQSGAPVDITSSRLLIDDLTKRAIFTGNVVAKQLEQVMETAELEVHYEGQPGGVQQSGQPGSQPAGQTPGSASNRLSKIITRTDVVLTRGIEKATGSAGEFDAVTDRATLMGPVAISAGPDRGATSDRADIDNKNDTILLTGSVVVTQQKNVLKGRRLRVDRKKGTMELESPATPGVPKGRISALLHQAENEGAAHRKAAAPAAQATPQGPFSTTMRADPDQPILIDADRLDVDDKAKTAIFRGKVQAKQGEYTILTEELVATYKGDSGLALGASPALGAGQQKSEPNKSEPAKASAQLDKVTAPRLVDIIAKDGQRARGNSAIFDTKANVATLTGDVRLSQGSSITTGSCARLDMNTGSMRIVDACGFAAQSPPATAAAPGKAVTTGVQSSNQPPAPPAGQPPVQSPGRAQVLIFPGLMKEEQQKEREKAKAAASPPPSAAPAAPPQAPRPAPSRRFGSDDAHSNPFGN